MELCLILIAVAWHAGLVALERHLDRNGTTPSVLRLLFTAEMELLRSLRAELKRLSAKDANAAMELFQVEQRLRELGEYG
ncbi:MAG: hypothetical protein QW835_01660 [Candidatus Hadarchaeum sp.]|uniref:hypothetical protein n=1 Tax=Candidatus Hadarchaeum sp. TaxID=2883567 RepID=UPI00317277FE